MAGTTCWSRTGRAAPARTPATTSAWAASRKVTGPFLDNMGIDMLQGGGKLFLGSGGRHIGPGHFGLLDLGDGVQKFSLPLRGRSRSRRHQRARHPSAALARRLARGRRQLQGRHLRDRIRADGHGARAGRAGHAGRRLPRQGVAAAAGEAAGAGRTAVAAGAPARTHSRAGCRAGRRRTGRPATSTCACRRTWCRPSRSGRSRPSPTPAAIRDRRISRSRSPAPIARSPPRRTRELVALPAFTGGPEQLWRIDQLTDGTYRMMPKAVPNAKEPLALSAVGSSMPTLRQIQPDSDRQRWLLKTP